MPTTQSSHVEYTLNEWCRPPFTTMLETVFSDSSVQNFVDLGANVGGVIQSLEKLNYIPRLKKIVCFEPDADNFAFLQTASTAIQARHGIEITCHNFGIYYGKTEAQVCGTGDGNIGGYFVQDDTIPRPVHAIPYDRKIFCLDTLEKHIDFPIDILKIDIEGSEMNVAAHSSAMKNSKYIIFEWHFDHRLIHDFIKTHLPNHDIIADYIQQQNYLLRRRD